MKIKHLIFSAIGSYIFFLIILIPASSVVSAMKLPTNTISLSGISGSVWSGTIDNAIISNHSLQSLSWTLNPLHLFTADIGMDLQSHYAGQLLSTQLDYSLFTNEILLTQLRSKINAADLQKQLHLPFGELVGSILLDMDSVRIKPGSLPAINGYVSWDNAQIKLYSTISIGQLMLRLESSDSGEISGILNNTGGDVSIEGDIKISTNKRYNLNIKLSPRANASKDLLNILKLVAPTKNKSDHIIRRSGHLKVFGII